MVLDKSRLPSRVDRRRSFLGQVKSSLSTNPLICSIGVALPENRPPLVTSKLLWYHR